MGGVGEDSVDTWAALGMAWGGVRLGPVRLGPVRLGPVRLGSDLFIIQKKQSNHFSTILAI